MAKKKWILCVAIMILSIGLNLWQYLNCEMTHKAKIKVNATFICNVNMYNFHETLNDLYVSYNSYILGANSKSEVNDKIMMDLDYCLDYLARVDTASQLCNNSFGDTKNLSNYVVMMQYMRETIFDSSDQLKSIEGTKIVMKMVNDILSGFSDNSSQKHYCDILTNSSIEWMGKVNEDYVKFLELFPEFKYAGVIS